MSQDAAHKQSKNDALNKRGVIVLILLHFLSSQEFVLFFLHQYTIYSVCLLFYLSFYNIIASFDLFHICLKPILIIFHQQSLTKWYGPLTFYFYSALSWVTVPSVFACFICLRFLSQ